MADYEDYMQEGWDPKSVTIPRLRSILVTNNIDYPSTAKKAQLVELVHNEVLPQVPRLRRQRDKAHRSSFGIVNAGSAEDVSNWADEPTPAKRSKTPRKPSARIKVEEEEDAMPPARRRSARSTSRALSHADESEYREPPTSVQASRRTSRRTVTPQPPIKPEPQSESEPEQLSEDEDEEQEKSVFTDDNPFQGGGSSPPQVKTPVNRRRTTADDIVRSAKSSARRRTDGFHDHGRPRKSFELSPPNMGAQNFDDELEPSEEFTPDEQFELDVAARQGESTALARQPRQRARRSSPAIPLLVLFTALLGAYAAWYRQEKIAVGYCGLGRPATKIIPPDVHLPDALVPFVEPQCEQCPPHAYCYEDFSVRCEPDFVLRPHPLSFGGLVPLPPTCEPDGEKARRVQSVADRAVEELRDRRAKFECGELKDEEGHVADSPAIPEDELKSTVSQKRSKRLNSDEFDDLWAAAIGDVTSREEVEVQTPERSDSTGDAVRQLSSTSLARLPVSCAVKRSVRLGLARSRLPIGLLILTALFGAYMRTRYRRHVATSAQIPALVDLVLGRLSNQKVLGEDDMDDPWLFLPNLRDDVLRSVHSLSERERIWQKVKKVVEQNSNVRTSQREGRSGEVGRAWEWIGPVAGDGARRRKSGRVSWGPEIKAETPETEGRRESMKWEDPRPIY